MKTILEIGLGAGGSIALLLVWWNVRYQRKLAEHHGMPRASFLTYFSDRGISTEVAAAVYDYYASMARSKTFGISPEDEIAVLFNQEGDDTEDDFKRVLKKLGLEMPYDSAWEARTEPLMRTVEDFVRAVVWAGENQPSAQRERGSRGVLKLFCPFVSKAQRQSADLQAVSSEAALWRLGPQSGSCAGREQKQRCFASAGG